MKNIVVEMEKPSPYQHSGEAMGYVEKLTFRICPKKLKLLKF